MALFDPVSITREIEATPFAHARNVVIAYPHFEDWKKLYKPQPLLALGLVPDGQISSSIDFAVQSPLQKYFASPVGQIISTNSRHPTPPEGRIAIVTDAGCGCGGRGSVLRAMGSQGGLAKGL